MKQAKKLGFWAKMRRAVLKNFWEGAVRWSPNRSFILEEHPRDARQDLSKLDLDELIRKNRYFAKNGPAVYIGLQSLFARYTVGSDGIKIVPASADIDFNKRASEAWEEACQNIEISGKSYAKASEEGANTLFCDGSFFIVKTKMDVPPVAGKPSQVPKIWLLERHRLQSPPDRQKDEGKTLHNGIELDPTMRFPIKYWVRTGNTVTEYPAKDVEHVFDSTRPGQLDGVPILAPAVNLLNDLSDLQVLQMKKAKAAADVANMVFNEAGEMTDEDALRDDTTVTTQDSQGTAVDEDRTKRLREAHGGSWSFFRTGEDVKQFKSESPTVTEQWHWRKTETDICTIGGSSVQLVFPESIQGTVQRSDIEIAAAGYRGWSCLQGQHWGNVYLWWLEWAIKNDPRLKKHPEDYRKHEKRPPRGPNVDVGRNGKQLLAEIEAGIRTFSSAYTELQQDWRQEITQKADEAQFIKKLAAERGLDISEISTLQQDRKERFDSGMQPGGGGKPGNVPPKKEDDD